MYFLLARTITNISFTPWQIYKICYYVLVQRDSWVAEIKLCNNILFNFHWFLHYGDNCS
jgi:hypothetical protein